MCVEANSKSGSIWDHEWPGYQIKTNSSFFPQQYEIMPIARQVCNILMLSLSRVEKQHDDPLKWYISLQGP